MVLITAERLRELFHYDPDTGQFTRLLRTTNSVRIGDIAGRLQVKGYRGITICRREYKAHRLAWLYMTGEWPPEEIDHINGVGSDNRFCNLRLASHTMNLQNFRVARKDNKVGLLGVSPHGSGFAATIRLNGEQLWLGKFKTPEEAHTVYLKAKRKLHEGCTI